MSATMLHVQGARGEPLPAVIAEALARWADRGWAPPAEIHVPAAPEVNALAEVDGIPLRENPMLRYQGDVWQVAVGPVVAGGAR